MTLPNICVLPPTIFTASYALVDTATLMSDLPPEAAADKASFIWQYGSVCEPWWVRPWQLPFLLSTKATSAI